MIRLLFQGVAGRAVSGWVHDTDRQEMPLPIHILLDNRLVAEGTANWYGPGSCPSFFSPLGCCGFNINLPAEEVDGREVTLALDMPVGSQGQFFRKKIRLPNLDFQPLPPPPDSSPISLAICAVVRNEAPYLLEWLAWHRLIGVERFYLFDNTSSDGTTIMLSALARAGIIDHVVWPDIAGSGVQVAAYMAGQGRIGQHFAWVAFIDADEFLHPLKGETLPQILGDYTTAAGLVVPWRTFGSNHEETWRDDLVVARFTKRARDGHPANSMVKTIVQTRALDKPMVHTPVLREGSLVDEHGVVAGRWGHPDHHPVASPSRLVLNHYFCKSREEWSYKRARGRASLPRGSADSYRKDSDFAGHDANEIEDRGLAQRADEIRQEMTELTRRIAQV